MNGHFRKWLLALFVTIAGCAGADDARLIQKQLALTSEQKLEFDRVFFNEIWLWNQTSWRYGQPSGPKRQKEFEAMAAAGYLPAYVALKMFDFVKQTKAADAAAFELLRRAADAGDVSSACALIPIWAWNDIPGYPRTYEWAVPHVELGTKVDHFACQEQMEELYRKGAVAAPNPEHGKTLLLRAAGQGYTRAFMVLHSQLEIADKILVDRLDRTLCWDVAYSLYTPFMALRWGYYDAAARGAYPQLSLSEEERAEIARLAKKWKSRMEAARVIMDVVNECLILEGEVK